MQKESKGSTWECRFSAMAFARACTLPLEGTWTSTCTVIWSSKGQVWPPLPRMVPIRDRCCMRQYVPTHCDGATVEARLRPPPPLLRAWECSSYTYTLTRSGCSALAKRECSMAPHCVSS